MSTVSPSKAKRFARTLRRENRKFKRTWRKIASEDYNDKVDQSTLSRIARENGEYIPVDKEILLTLGLIKPRKPRPKQKTVMKMNKHELIEHFNKRIEKMNLVLVRRGVHARVQLNNGRQA